MDYISLYILTFNCARNLIEPDLFASHLFDALPNSARDANERQTYGAPEIIVLSLQEIAPIAYAFLGESFLAAYFDAFRCAIDLAVSRQWGNDVDYVDIIKENSGLTAIMVFVRSDVSRRISWMETAQVGVGVQQMGNKGAVGARLGYAIEDRGINTVDLTFVAAHLAAMEDACECRNEDWKSIVERLVFSRKRAGSQREGEPGLEQEEDTALVHDSTSAKDTSYSGIFVPTSHLFIAGDLNYRTSDTMPQKDDYNRFPQPTMDSDSSQHYSHLLKNDQLTREVRKGKTLHGLSEEPITFPPTYKYTADACLAAHSNGEPVEWRWARNRWPSWCDRILYLDTPSWTEQNGHIQSHVYEALPLIPTSDHRPVALSVSVPLKPIPKPVGADQPDDVRLSVPFLLDLDWESKRAAARKKEIIVGCLAYLTSTWEGVGLLLATGIGASGGWFVLRSILEG